MFTADMARAIPAEAKFQQELSNAETRIRNLAATLPPRELAHHRNIGVLITATFQERMADAMRQRGFQVTNASQAGFLRIYW